MLFLLTICSIVFGFSDLCFNFLLFFPDQFPEQCFWIDLPGFCLIENILDFFYGELAGLSKYFFEMGVVK